MYLDSNGTALTSKSQNGHLASGIPGTIAGLFATMKYAKLSFEKLIQPSIELAEKGYRITSDEAKSLNKIQEDIKIYNTQIPVFQKSVSWKEGDTLIQADLANTLKRIRDNGEKGFYEGETATLIVEEMQRGGGIITYDDLKNYKAKSRDPQVFDYKGYTIVSMPMPSSGGVLLHQMLKMIESRPLASYGFHSVKAVQLMTEVERRAYADRAQFMGDADFYKVPVEYLVSEKYLQLRMKDYDSTKAGNSMNIKPGEISIKESEQTTHLNVIDKNGNAVAVTTTLNNSYGSKTVVGGAGFFLNDEMDDFSIKPGVPNLYGAIGGEANAIIAHKRMLSSMTPTLVLKDSLTYLIVGTPGGTTIPTSVFQTVVNIIDFGLSTDEAVNQLKFHHQWLPDTLNIEKGFSETVISNLEKMGYRIKLVGGIGRTEVIKVLPNGKFEAVADKRGEDGAEGY
jgi:gamma-glutamyltranspeptidase / glutathione hydrolase